LFQARILEELRQDGRHDNFVVLDGTLPVNKLQKQMRDIVASKIDLKRFAPARSGIGVTMPEQEKEKTPAAVPPTETPAGPATVGCGKNGAGGRRSFVPIFFLAKHWSDSIQAKLPAVWSLLKAWTGRDGRRRLPCCRNGWNRKASRCRRADCAVRIWWDGTSMNFWPRTPRRG